MLGLRSLPTLKRRVIRLKQSLRKYSNDPPARIRNLGIIAHIDAGKTTMTESMLYHAGKIRRMGSVDSGNTVTDFLPSERARGITVQSAAVSFNWNDYFMNLIDTPGHVDFTVEVERALHVLDGVVAVLDGSRGVEAQTRTVWRQADKLNIPKIVFVNKMDKPGADFLATVRSLQERLLANTFVTQFPIIDNGFCGIVDLINLTLTKWETTDQPGNFQTNILQPTDAELWEPSIALRRKLLEQLADLNDEVADMYLSHYSEDVVNFPDEILNETLGHAVRNLKGVPVLCGSALKDVGITALLDGVVRYLPSPADSNTKLLARHKGETIGYAFKVVHHNRFGPVVFARIISGKITSNSRIYNASKDKIEHVASLFTVFADEYKPVPSVSEGHIAAITGLKMTGTGDTIYSSKTENSETLAPVVIPPPVFFCTVEADTLTETKALEHSLAIIMREDPSIRIRRDKNSGQTILCGMGELHMEVVTERLKKEFKTNCYVGPIQVAYREKVLHKIKQSLSYKRKVFEKSHCVKMTLAAEPNERVNDLLVNVRALNESPEVIGAVRDGVFQSCQSGPIMGFPLTRTKVTVHNLQMTSGTPLTILTAGVVEMVNNILQQATCGVLEPMMNIEVVTTAEKLPLVLKSLAQKHASISEIRGEEAEKSITARAPVAEMLGYASKLRSVSSGNADLTLEVASYEEVGEENINSLKNRLIGEILQ